MKLVIVESPAKAKTIEGYLGEDFVVRASVGHVRDLPKSNKSAVDIEGGFVPNYQIVKGKEKIIDEIANLAEGANEVILATDPDREGEAIAWHLAESIGLKNPKRIVFHEITEQAIKEAMEHPRSIDQNLKSAQEARRVLDRLFGYDLSGLIWKKVRYGLSAGRVQSPALRILMEREREIRAFVPEDFWVITADLETGRGERFEAACAEEPRDEEEANRILEAAQRGSWTVQDVRESEQKRSARAPFITSTLQQTASTRLGFSPSRTMQVAQKLYEAGHITYMRTDSTNLSKQAQGQIISTVEKEFGKDYVAPRQFKTKSKSAQEAHEAIRPSSISRKSVGSTSEQKKMYELIRARTLASQMADARVRRVVLEAKVDNGSPDGEVPPFAARGARIVFDGWLAADPAARGEEVELPKVAVGERLTLVEANSEHKQTQPPSRYSEAGLIKELERRGIGRPSTYASIMKTLQDRGYVEKEGRTLMPTDTGDVVSTFLETHFADYISDNFTAEMENELDEIAIGKREYKKTLGDFYGDFYKSVSSKADIPKLTTLGNVPPEFECTECRSPMVYKLGKAGVFMSCSRFPDCLGARTREGEEIEPPKELDEKCPECGSPLIEREGRYGRFTACSNYPKCKYVKQDNLQNSTGVKCVTCKKGEIVEKRGRFGPFFACSNYPDCKHTMKARPTGEFCPECGKHMMQGTKTIPDRCEDKNCVMHRPDKIAGKK